MHGLANNPIFNETIASSSLENEQARILRNGLLICSFSLVETYIEDRINEKIADLSSSKIKYRSFSEKLRTFLTLDAVVGLNTRLSFADKNDRLDISEAGLLAAAAFLNDRPRYTALGFSPKGSNVSAADIKALLSAFEIDDGWRHLSAICSALGASRLSLEDDYKNFMKARHKAAHDSTSNVPSGDLQTYLGTALRVGLSADIALSNAVDAFAQHRAVVAVKARANAIPTFRFVDQEISGTFVERLSTRFNVVQRYATRDLAIAGAESRKKAMPIILRDSSLTPLSIL